MESMECNIYRCTSCGGELVVNGVETKYKKNRGMKPPVFVTS